MGPIIEQYLKNKFLPQNSGGGNNGNNSSSNITGNNSSNTSNNNNIGKYDTSLIDITF